MSKSESRSASDSSKLSAYSSSADKTEEDRYHPAHEEEKECKYSGEWGDCDMNVCPLATATGGQPGLGGGLLAGLLGKTKAASHQDQLPQRSTV